MVILSYCIRIVISDCLCRCSILLTDLNCFDGVDDMMVLMIRYGVDVSSLQLSLFRSKCDIRMDFILLQTEVVYNGVSSKTNDATC